MTMKSKALATVLMLALMTGCANQSEKRLAWEVKPVVDIRHGMERATALLQVGRYQQHQGDLRAAEKSYVDVLAADPRNADALDALGKLYAQRGDLERSAKAFRRLADLVPKRAYLYNNIGYAFYLQGRHPEAIDALRMAVTLDPEYERAWVNLETVARAADRVDLAAMAARRQLPAPESQPSQHAERGPMLAELAVSAERADLRLTMTPTLKVLTEPATMAALAAAEDSSPPVVVQIAAVQGPEVVPWTPQTTSHSSQGYLETRVAQSDDTAAAPTSGRVEVSNGNGIGGFATLVGRELRKEGVRVSRITNHDSFRVERSYIECRPEWNAAAQVLRDRLGPHVALREIEGQRRGTDIRVVLGRDSYVHLAKQPASKPLDKQQPLLLTLLAP
jgi:Tfp pilus assembly protein PilF